MTIKGRIQESIALHRRTANKDPDMVILSAAARRRFLNEAPDEGSPPSGLAPEDPEAVSSGVIGTVDGVPVRVQPNLPGLYVGVEGEV